MELLLLKSNEKIMHSEKLVPFIEFVKFVLIEKIVRLDALVVIGCFNVDSVFVNAD